MSINLDTIVMGVCFQQLQNTFKAKRINIRKKAS